MLIADIVLGILELLRCASYAIDLSLLTIDITRESSTSTLMCTTETASKRRSTRPTESCLPASTNTESSSREPERCETTVYIRVKGE